MARITTTITPSPSTFFSDMKAILVRACLVLVLPATALRAAEPAAAADYPLDAFVAVGSTFAQNTRLPDIGLTEEQFNAFMEGIRAAYRRTPRPLDGQSQHLHEMIGQRLKALEEEEQVARQNYFADPARLEAYMKDAVKNFRLQRSDTGMAYGLVSSGTSRPGPDDRVVVTYTAVTADGQTELPQISVKEKQVKVSDLLPGLAEGVMLLAAEGTALLVLPPDLTYAAGKWPEGVMHGTPLIFTVKLHSIVTAN